MKIGDVVEVQIVRLGVYGEGISSWEGRTLFVFGALPLEKVRVEIMEVRKNFARGKCIALLERSKERIQPPCPVFGKCGGCQLMHLSYQGQLREKRQKVHDALERIGKLDAIEVLPCIPSPHPLHYRNKIQLPTHKGCGSIQFGLYATDSHEVVPIETCYIHTDLGERVFQKMRTICQDFKLTAEEVRHLLIRSAVRTQEVLMAFITWKKESARFKKVAEEIVRVCPEVKGVFQNYNPKTTNRVFGTEFTLLAGREAIEEKICDLTFRISIASFFQVNVFQAEALYRYVLSLIENSVDVLLDAYCGVGTLSLILAQKAKKVVGIECVSEAIEDAKKNAKRNQISHVEFICDAAEHAIKTLTRVDLAIVNPPRKGCDSSFLDALQKLKPSKVIYISCDPATLARDLNILSQTYCTKTVQPFDMFPQTSHVESVALLALR